MIEVAQHYARQRWPVFPLIAGGKIPAIPKERGGHGCLDATLDVRRIESWWTEGPQRNVGIATGDRSGLLVIDIDTKDGKPGLASAQDLGLPRTFTVRTATGGFHAYFVLPTGTGITLGSGLLPGIDWRANGGYVVAAGSVVDGLPYEIVRSEPLQPAPSALLEQLQAAHRKPRILATDDHGAMVIPEGHRNEQLFRIGCALRRYGIGRAALIESLSAISTEHCEGTIPTDELEQIAESALRYVPTKVHP